LAHFLKYLFSFLIKDKKAKVIKSKLIIIFKKYGWPKQIGFDNGAEFNNNIINSY